MIHYVRHFARSRATFRAIALACGLAGAALGSAQVFHPVSPYGNPIDDQGRYMCPSPGVSPTSDGLAQVITAPAGPDVIERSSNVLAQQNTFTPNSDAYKRPMPASYDMRGKSASWDIDLGNPAEWAHTSPLTTEAFAVGIGTLIGSAGPTGPNGAAVIEAQYQLVSGVWHAFFRLRTSTNTTDTWHDAGPYDPTPGSTQVKGTYRVRLDINGSPSAGTTAFMTVTPMPFLVPLPNGIYNDVLSSEPTSITGRTPFISGFWSSGLPGGACAAARIVRASTSSGEELTMWLKSVHPFMTTAKGANLGNPSSPFYDRGPNSADPALQSNEFHLGVSNFVDELIRGFQAFGHYYTEDDVVTPYPFGLDSEWVYDYTVDPIMRDPRTFYDQSYVDATNGPFVYIRSRFVFDFPLINVIEGTPASGTEGSHLFFRSANGSSPATESLNSDAEILSLPIHGVQPFPLGEDPFPVGLPSGGAIRVNLDPSDPDVNSLGQPILGNAGFTLDGGIVTSNVGDALRGSDDVIVDEVRPEAGLRAGDTCTGVLEGTTNLSSNPNNAFEGTVSVDFWAGDHGNGNAPTGSGLGATPRAVLEFNLGTSTSPNWQTLATGTPITVCPSACGDNHWHGAFDITSCTRCGDYRVEFQAQDRVGLLSLPSFGPVIHVHTLVAINVTLTLDTPANNQRLIEFELGSAAGTPVPTGGTVANKAEIYKLVRFRNGVSVNPATGLPGPITLSAGDTSALGGGSGVIPSCDAQNLVIWAKDEQHTLADSEQLSGPGCTMLAVNGIYSVTLELLSGDNNDDNLVNFADYAFFVNDYSNNAPADMTSYTWYRNSDFNGNGQVDFADWALFYPHFGLVGDPEPGQFVFNNAMVPSGSGGFGGSNGPGDVNIHDPHLTRMPVRQLVRMGIVDAPKWDLNHDGWIDMSELYRAMNGKRGGR